MAITPHMLNSYAWLAWVVYWYAAAYFVKKAKYTEGFWGRLQHMLPLAVAMYLLFRDRHDGGLMIGRLYDNDAVAWLGALLTLAGLLGSVWARLYLGKYWSGIITLKEDHKIIRTGPYRFVRHPIYTGLLLAALGSALTAATGDAFIGVAILLPAFVIKLRREETLLTKEFGDGYLTFKREVSMLVPFIW